MQAADDVEFGDAEFKGVAGFFDDFFDGKLEAVGIALFAGESAELATENAVVGVVDVAIDDVAGAITVFAAALDIRDCAEGVEIGGLEELLGVSVGDSLAGVDFGINVPQ